MLATVAHRELDYYSWVGVTAPHVGAVVEKVEHGLPFRALERFGKLLALDTTERAARLVRIPTRTLYTRKRSRRLTPTESDRLLRTTRLFGLAVDLFDGNKEAARQWFFAPQRALGGATPAQYSQTEVGAREVEDLIGRLEHGVFS